MLMMKSKYKEINEQFKQQ